MSHNFDRGQQRYITTVSRRARYAESFLLSKVRDHAKISSSDLFVAQQAEFFGAGWKHLAGKFTLPETSKVNST
jgi:hypothetical protein